ncbi:MAG: S8 family serine peptidase [Proteiniphilum sp.]|jgi:subtilisin family serine protease|nr:S8 family serine peptidase [Proteiniphilum sp.]
MKYLFTLLLLLLSAVSSALPAMQPLQYRFRVYLSDKGESGYSLAEPEKFLTEKAIERKKRQAVVIDASDLPISPDYFTLVEKTGATVVTYSKWMQTLTVQVADSLKIDQLLTLPFVDSVKYVWRGTGYSYHHSMRPRLEMMESIDTGASENLFGFTEDQFSIHNAEQLALAGFRGKGIDVAVIDAGFTNFDVIPLFSSVNMRGWKNFVPEGDIFASSDHGTKVLSTMATNQPGLLMGSAPEADYWLLRSEDVTSEFPVEEDYWVRAVEYADSLGVDVINSSLGYNHFDDKLLNYTHADLTGDVSIMSIAADMAYEKGMLVVVSAGNEGNKPWQKSTPPGDAKNVLTVGSVGTDSLISSFSSHGITADGRIKPDLVSVGSLTFTIGQEGLIGFTSGTSLSSPFLAGLAASLWSINPDLHRSELTGIILASSDRYALPDSVYGHGIPDFQKAMTKVLSQLKVEEDTVTVDDFTFSRPSQNNLFITLTAPIFSVDAYQVNLLAESGRLIAAYTFEKEQLHIVVPPSVRETEQFLHLVFITPFTQRTIRIKM